MLRYMLKYKKEKEVLMAKAIITPPCIVMYYCYFVVS